ncbi:LiaI-LiaF-like domain-containing protein [Mucilaginibacter gotjawali]|uniref:Uncharacterized protein n=2 Tax=Mucilaginibacter gotjawali TaxID=1550579 RepID=A0A125T235_9SPHI|nr:DUF5668 domain-containing protein [Mucilaginibacter gotjawali]MBB3057891.1 hypothetical protein [Mucilaginibacter gotjawali]BAU52337.1 hypothetical protein MgSA37_00492 [Mucilaginibacter gotjawali]
MKNDKLIPGVILVLIGAAILLANYGYLHFHWWNIFRLWPIFLVIGGINLLFAHNKSPWASVLKISVVVFGFGLVLFGNFGDRYSFWPGSHINWNNNDDNDDNNSDDNNDDNDKGDVKPAVNGVFNEPYNARIKVARLNVSGGATSYYLSGTTDQLFSAATRDNSNRYILTSSKDEDSVYVVNFHMKDRNGANFDSDKSRADFSLNTNPIWEIHADAAAAKLDFDLSKFKVKELKLNGAAGSFTVKLGDPLESTNVEVSNAASDVRILIPQNAACEIETDTGLSGNDFEGFNDVGDSRHETTGFAAAKNKIHIHIKGIVSGFKVNKY